MKITLLNILIIINFFCYISFYFGYRPPIIHFTYISIILSIVFIIIIFLITKVYISKRQLFLLLSIGILFRIILIPISPISSDDVYRYIWDGKVQFSGINPYSYTPLDNALKHLHSEILPSKVKFSHLKTIYPPYSQWMFFLAYLISGEEIWGIKILLLLFEIITIILSYFILKKIKLEEKNSLVYALSPLPIMQFFIDAHLDGFGISLLALFFYLFISNRNIYSYLVLGVSICTKLITIIIIPLLLRGLNVKNMIYAITLPLIVVFLIYIPYTIDGSPFEALFIFAKKWYSNSLVYNVLQNLFGDNSIARMFIMLLFVLSYIWIYFSDKKIVEKIYLSFYMFFIFSPVVHPWYISWIAILTTINFRWSGIVFISTISIANFYPMNYLLYNKWEISQWLLVVEYLPVIILLVIEEIKSKKLLF